LSANEGFSLFSAAAGGTVGAVAWPKLNGEEKPEAFYVKSHPLEKTKMRNEIEELRAGGDGEGAWKGGGGGGGGGGRGCGRVEVCRKRRVIKRTMTKIIADQISKEQ
jgi:hypothetical protein